MNMKQANKFKNRMEKMLKVKLTVVMDVDNTKLMSKEKDFFVFYNVKDKKIYLVEEMAIFNRKNWLYIMEKFPRSMSIGSYYKYLKFYHKNNGGR